MPDITIRRAQFTDIESILEIEHGSAGSWSYSQFINELNNRVSLFLVAELENSIAGYIVAWKVAGEIQLNNIAVKKSFRKQGIGGRLLSAITAGENGTGFFSIYLEVRSRNSDAINFYTDNGFKKTGIRKNYYYDDDALLMEKKL